MLAEPSSTRPWLLGALAAVAVVIAVVPDLRPGVANWDTRVKTEVAWNVLHGRGPILTRAPAPLYLIPGSDGRTYAPYPPFAYVLQLPSALSALWFNAAVEGLAPLLLLAMTGWVLVITGLRLGASSGAAAAGALLACLGTALRPMVGVGHDNGIEALALAAMLWASTFEDRPAAFAWAGLSTGAALATRLGAVPLLVPAAVLVLVQRPRTWLGVIRRGIAFAAGVAPGLAAVLAFNFYRYGSPFELQPGNEAVAMYVPWLTAAHWSGVLGLAVSPGKGLLWYSPPLIAVALLAAPLARRFPAVMAALGAYLAVGLVFYGRLTFWHGDWGWGPRYVSPASLAAAPLVWWAWERLASSRLRLGLLAGAASLLVAIQAFPNFAFPLGVYLQEISRRAELEGTPAPQLVFPMLKDSDYFYFRLDTSPIVVLARAFARGLGSEPADARDGALGEKVRRGLAWSPLGPALFLALVTAANRRAIGPPASPPGGRT
ncbi:MAG TPA: hypothetical protein VFP50_18835 [Anaeromyxobacteraceae bacterium]|nr:hypothetical protein [Anaeromyxobacteraceae bacterium]